MKSVQVDLGERSYPVLIEPGLLDHAADHLRPFARDDRLIVVSDTQVWAHQGARFRAGLGGIAVDKILLEPGEASKSWSGLTHLCDALLARGLSRSDTVVAFGGGVVGDLTGFAAAIVKRGLRFVQIPTTLLAQVDSSVGGKTGINTDAGKNMIGAFHQPAAVLIDPACLQTLGERQRRAGYAEIVKYALIEDAAFFDWLDDHGAQVIAGEPEPLSHAIHMAVAGKARIVAADERESSGRRALLNLGHTFAHALEAQAGYSDRLLHGEAVAMGLALAFRLSAERGLCDPADAARVDQHLASVGLETRLSVLFSGSNPSSLADLMRADKKADGGRLSFILARGIGRAFVDRSVTIDEVTAFLGRQLSAP